MSICILRSNEQRAPAYPHPQRTRIGQTNADRRYGHDVPPPRMTLAGRFAPPPPSRSSPRQRHPGRLAERADVRAGGAAAAYGDFRSIFLVTQLAEEAHADARPHAAADGAASGKLRLSPSLPPSALTRGGSKQEAVKPFRTS